MKEGCAATLCKTLNLSIMEEFFNNLALFLNEKENECKSDVERLDSILRNPDSSDFAKSNAHHRKNIILERHLVYKQILDKLIDFNSEQSRR